MINISKFQTSATIAFINGNTSGQHYIKATDFKEVCSKLDEFFRELESK